jgi:hypothetical protein
MNKHREFIIQYNSYIDFIWEYPTFLQSLSLRAKRRFSTLRFASYAMTVYFYLAAK